MLSWATSPVRSYKNVFYKLFSVSLCTPAHVWTACTNIQYVWLIIDTFIFPVLDAPMYHWIHGWGHVPSSPTWVIRGSQTQARRTVAQHKCQPPPPHTHSWCYSTWYCRRKCAVNRRCYRKLWEEAKALLDMFVSTVNPLRSVRLGSLSPALMWAKALLKSL